MALPVSPVTTANTANLLFPGLNTIFGLGYNDHDPIFMKLCDVSTSERNFERDLLMTGVGLPRTKGESTGTAYDGMAQAWQQDYKHINYALGMIISEEELDDDLYGIVGPARAKALGRAFRINKDIITSNIYNNAFTSSVTYGDAIQLCSTAHPIATGANLANRPSVDANLSEAALENAFVDMNQNFVDNRGLKIEARVKSLLIAPQDQFNASRILDSALQNNTSNNALNALKAYGTIPEVVVDVYFTSSVAWFLRTDVANGVRMFTRKALAFTADNDFDTANLKFKGMERFSVGVTDFRGVYGSSGS